MYLVVLALHVLVCVCLIGLVLLQRSEGGALGMGGGSSSALMSGRGAADALARMTQFAGGLFLITSLSLTVISGAASSGANRSIFDSLPQSTGFRQSAPAPAPATTPTAPAPTPAQPTPARPDPTQSSAPQAAPPNALAAIMPGPSSAQAATIPASAVGAERAAPLGGQHATVTPPPARNTTGATVQQASTNPVRVPAQPSTTPARVPATPTHNQSVGATNQQASGAAPNLVLPQSPGSLALTQAGAQTPESSDPNAVTAVRRERAAGPDQ